MGERKESCEKSIDLIVRQLIVPTPFHDPARKINIIFFIEQHHPRGARIRYRGLFRLSPDVTGVAVRVREAGKSMAGVFLKAVCRLDSGRLEPWYVARHEEAKE